MHYRIVEILHKEKGGKLDGLLRDYLAECEKVPKDQRFTTFGHIKVIAALAEGRVTGTKAKQKPQAQPPKPA